MQTVIRGHSALANDRPRISGNNTSQKIKFHIQSDQLSWPLAGELELETWLSWRLSLRRLDLLRLDDPRELGVDGGVSSDTDVVSDKSSTPLTGPLTPAETASIVLISAAIRSTSRGFPCEYSILIVSSRSALSLVAGIPSESLTTPTSSDHSDSSSLTPRLLRQLIIHKKHFDSALVFACLQHILNVNFTIFLV